MLATKTTTLGLAGLIPDPSNPNSMTSAQYEALVHAIRLRGPLQPLLVWERAAGEYHIVDGHHRARAMLDLGITDAAAVVLPPSTPREAIQQLRLGMNRIRGTVSLDAAEAILRELAAEGVGLDELITTGFSSAEITELLNPPEPTPAVVHEPSAEVLPEKPHILELAFSDAATLQKVKKALRKAGGKTKDEAVGLLHLLGMEAR